jgi:hypothetical protein
MTARRKSGVPALENRQGAWRSRGAGLAATRAAEAEAGAETEQPGVILAPAAMTLMGIPDQGCCG